MAKKRSQRKGSGRKSSASNKPQETQRSSGGGSSAASRTRARREAREAERKRRRNITYAVIAGIVAIIIVGVVVIINQPQDAPIPSSVEALAGIPQTVDDNGFPVLGDPNAPVEVTEYSSFSCPACGNWHDDNWDRMLEEIRAGVVSFTYIPLQTGAIPNAAGASRYALCAGEQGQFWEFHEALFSWQRNFGNRAFTQQRLDTGVENFGFEVGEFNSCRNSSATSQLINLANQLAVSNNATSTPTFRVQGINVSQNELFGRIDSTLENWRASTGLEPTPLDAPATDEDVTEVETTPEITEEPMAEATEEMMDEAMEATEEASADAEMTEEVTEEPEGTEEVDESAAGMDAEMTEEPADEPETTDEPTDEAEGDEDETTAEDEAGTPGIIIFP